MEDLAKLEDMLSELNISPKLDEDEKTKIADMLCRAIEQDDQSRSGWLKANDQYLKMALQIKEPKTFPWPNAANIKYPLITVASLQFQARAYASIVNSKQIVKGKVIGFDPNGQKAARADRISKHMSYQLTDKIENWDEDMDKLLFTLPIVGTMFKKVFWNSKDELECIELVYPQDLIVNYWANDLESSRRITHQYYLYHDEVLSRMKQGLYEEVELPMAAQKARSSEEDLRQMRNLTGAEDEDVPHKIWEVCTYLDLDEDGIKEPYVVVLEVENRKILRIAPNFNLKGIKKNEKGEVYEIQPRQYYVKYGFFPSPDGGFYDVGFGLLLGNLNETASTAINQLLDTGTMSATGGGLIGRAVKLKGGHLSFAPNEWKQVAFAGDDLSKQVFPIPKPEPSAVLLSLLQFIDQKGREIISISEVSTGKLPGQNTPATTTLTSVEEGLKIFNSIYKRIYRALNKEIKLLKDLNAVKLQDTEYFSILDGSGTFKQEEVTVADYEEEGIDVVPVADPNAGNDSIKLIKAQQIVELIPLGAVNPGVAGQRILEALDIPNPQELMPQPQPDPKVQAMQMKGQIDQQKAQVDMQSKQQDMQIKEREAQMEFITKMLELRFKQQEQQMDMQFKQMQHQLEMMMGRDKIALSRMEGQGKLQHQQASNAVSLEGKKRQMALKDSNEGKKS